MTDELLEMIAEAADSFCTLYLHYDGKSWSGECGECIDELDGDTLRDYIRELEHELGILDGQEPKNANSDAYDSWADAHEDLEDLLDECRDRLDELEN